MDICRCLMLFVDILAFDSTVILYSVLMVWILVPSSGQCMENILKNAMIGYLVSSHVTIHKAHYFP